MAADGVQRMVSRDRMHPSARRVRDIYACTPGAPFVQREFGFYCLDRWKEQGMPPDVPLSKLFGYEESGQFGLGGLGWCEAFNLH